MNNERAAMVQACMLNLEVAQHALDEARDKILTLAADMGGIQHSSIRPINEARRFTWRATKEVELLVKIAKSICDRNG